VTILHSKKGDRFSKKKEGPVMSEPLLSPGRGAPRKRKSITDAELLRRVSPESQFSFISSSLIFFHLLSFAGYTAKTLGPFLPKPWLSLASKKYQVAAFHFF